MRSLSLSTSQNGVMKRPGVSLFMAVSKAGLAVGRSIFAVNAHWQRRVGT